MTSRPQSESPTKRSGGWIVSMVLAAWCVVAPGRAEADSPPTIQDARIGFRGMLPPRGRTPRSPYKIATWTPIHVQVRGGSSAWKGRLDVSAPDSDGAPSVSSVALDLEPDATTEATAYVRVGTFDAEIGLKLIADGKTVPEFQSTLDARMPLGWSSILVLQAGTASGLEELPGLSKFPDASDGSPGLALASWDELPQDPLGLSAVEALVLAPDASDVLERLAGAEGKVVRDWLAHGGHLIVSLSATNWQRSARVLEDLLPARPVGTQPLVDLSAVEGFAARVTNQIKPPMTVVRLEPVDSRSLVLAASSASPLVVRRAYGLGRVTLTGVDVSAEPFRSWADRRSYWDRLLDIRGRSQEGEAAMARGAIIQAANPDLSARMLQALGEFRGARLIPFGWVASLIFAYLLLIGPIEYYFLKRVLKRMELTWVTFPIIVIATTGLAFAVARSWKGTDLRVNRIDLLDVDQGSGVWRGATWLTLFSPGNHEYELQLVPELPDSGSQASDAAIASPALSWAAPPEVGLSGLARMAIESRTSRHPRDGRLDALAGERVPIWSTKSFLGRWTGSGPPVTLLESALRVEPGDRAGGSLRNRSGHTLHRAQLYFGKNVYDLGTIRPDQVARVTSNRSEALPRALGRFVQDSTNALRGRGKTTNSAAARRGEIESSVPSAGFLRAALFHDAMGSRADLYPSFPLRWLDMTSQTVDLRRPILVAEIEDPAGQASNVQIKGAGMDPSVQPLTVIRIVLDLDPSPSAAGAAPARADETASTGTSS